MNESYEIQIQGAKDRLNESLAAAAADVLVIAEAFGKELFEVAKRVTEDAPETYKRVLERARRLQNRRSDEVSTGTSTDKTPIEVRRARSDLRRDGVLDAVLADPDMRERLTEAVAADPSLTATVASKVEAKRPSTTVRSSAGTGGGIVGTTNRIDLLDSLDHAVLVIEDKLPEFTAAEAFAAGSLAIWRRQLRRAIRRLRRVSG